MKSKRQPWFPEKPDAKGDVGTRSMSKRLRKMRNKIGWPVSWTTSVHGELNR